MILALKIVLTPLLIAAATLAGRRWGPAVSGWLIGFPLTSGPVSLILASQFGAPFEARAAIGTLADQASVCVFCLAYSLAAQRSGWLACAAVGVGAFAAAEFAWDHFTLALVPTFAILLLTIVAVLKLMPQSGPPAGAAKPPRWDLPARMVVATSFVMLLTTFATPLGPQLSGLLSPFPIFGIVLATFAHREQGSGAATQVVRGIVLGSVAFAAFFVLVAAFVANLATPIVYALATAAAVAASGISLRAAMAAA